MSKPCIIKKDFGWLPTGFVGRKGSIVHPPAMLREIWIRRGFVEVFGEEAAEQKEAQQTESPREVKRKRGRPPKNRSAFA